MQGRREILSFRNEMADTLRTHARTNYRTKRISRFRGVAASDFPPNLRFRCTYCPFWFKSAQVWNRAVLLPTWQTNQKVVAALANAASTAVRTATFPRTAPSPLVTRRATAAVAKATGATSALTNNLTHSSRIPQDSIFSKI